MNTLTLIMRNTAKTVIPSMTMQRMIATSQSTPKMRTLGMTTARASTIMRMTIMITQRMPKANTITLSNPETITQGTITPRAMMATRSTLTASMAPLPAPVTTITRVMIMTRRARSA